MSLEWETVDRSAHEQLPKKTTVKSPEWEDILNELQHTNNAVRLKYTDQKERGALARSVGRRAAHRGFKVDIRQGENFISVSRVAEQSEGAKGKN